MNCAKFEKLFEIEHHSKKEWNAQKTNLGPNCYGWCALADDYDAEGVISDFLHYKGQLRIVSDIDREAAQSRNNVVADLANEIDITNENLNELQYKHNEKTMSLSRMLEEKNRLHKFFEEGLYLHSLSLSFFVDAIFIHPSGPELCSFAVSVCIC